MEIDFTVYKLKIQPGAAEPETNPYEFCKQEGIIGVGWWIDEDEFPAIIDVDPSDQSRCVEALQEAHNQIGKGRILKDGRLKAELRYIIHEMDEGDYVWVNEGGEYALCRVESGVRTPHHLESVNEISEYKRRDIGQYRIADWKVLPLQFVPGYVKSAFAGRHGTISKMNTGNNNEAKRVIKWLYETEDLAATVDVNREKVAEELRDVSTEEDALRLLQSLDYEETEDIVIDLLQSRGWHVVKSSTNSSQPLVECELRRVVDGESEVGYVQVKTGMAGISLSKYEGLAETSRVFVFSFKNPDTSSYDGISTVEPAEVIEHLADEPGYISDSAILKLSTTLKQSSG